MSNAIRTPDERQGATYAERCSSCISTGHDCSWCGKSFVLGDLRVSVEGLPNGERLHFLCAEGKGRPLSLDLLDPGLESTNLREAGLGILEELTPVVLGDMKVSDMRATMGRLLVLGYLVELRSPSATPTAHVDGMVASDICDFCSSTPMVGSVEPGVFWHFVSKRAGEKPIRYSGPWGYCSACQPLVKAKDHVGLARRAMEAKPPAELNPERRKKHFEGLYQRVVKEGADGS